MSKVVHYRDKCIGCGVCYEQQPGRWRMSKKDGKATLINGVRKKEVYVLELPAAEYDLTKEVALACPVRVIKVS